MGFGTKDASKRDEFAATIRTEQYRETLKRENTILDEQRDREKEDGELRYDMLCYVPLGCVLWCGAVIVLVLLAYSPPRTNTRTHHFLIHLP